eukprot:3071186-Alexandrium_andersonii.AAC.1
MDALESSIAAFGLEYACFDWYVASLLHYWARTRPFQSRKQSKLPPVPEHTAHSTCVVCFPQT